MLCWFNQKNLKWRIKKLIFFFLPANNHDFIHQERQCLKKGINPILAFLPKAPGEEEEAGQHICEKD